MIKLTLQLTELLPQFTLMSHSIIAIMLLMMETVVMSMIPIITTFQIQTMMEVSSMVVLEPQHPMEAT